MVLPHYVAPVIAAGGPLAVACIFFRLFLRFGLDAIARLVLAVRIAFPGRDDDKGLQERVQALRALCGRDESPPVPQSEPPSPSRPATSKRRLLGRLRSRRSAGH